MHRLLVIGRVLPGREDELAKIFAEADGGDLPSATGVRHRSIYRIGDLYLHLTETDSTRTQVEQGQDHPALLRVADRLAECTTPYPVPEQYVPQSVTPHHATASCFYRWEASGPNRKS